MKLEFIDMKINRGCLQAYKMCYYIYSYKLFFTVFTFFAFNV